MLRDFVLFGNTEDGKFQTLRCLKVGCLLHPSSRNGWDLAIHHLPNPFKFQRDVWSYLLFLLLNVKAQTLCTGGH